MRRESRRGSQAIEFALIFPVFIALVFGGLDYSWYVLQRYTAMDVVAGGCRAGAITGVDLYATPIESASAAITERAENSILTCGRELCSVTVEQIDGYSPSTTQLQCSLAAPTMILSGLVPLLPDNVTAKSTWPVEPFTNYELLEELGY